MPFETASKGHCYSLNWSDAIANTGCRQSIFLEQSLHPSNTRAFSYIHILRLENQAAHVMPRDYVWLSYQNLLLLYISTARSQPYGTMQRSNFSTSSWTLPQDVLQGCRVSWVQADCSVLSSTTRTKNVALTECSHKIMAVRHETKKLFGVKNAK